MDALGDVGFHRNLPCVLGRVNFAPPYSADGIVVQTLEQEQEQVLKTQITITTSNDSELQEQQEQEQGETETDIEKYKS